MRSWSIRSISCYSPPLLITTCNSSISHLLLMTHRWYEFRNFRQSTENHLKRWDAVLCHWHCYYQLNMPSYGHDSGNDVQTSKLLNTLHWAAEIIYQFTIGFNWTIIGNAGEEIVTCEIHSESMNICQNFMSLNLSITLHTLERAQQTWFLRLKVSPNCCNVFQCCQCIARIISYTWYDVKWVCVCWLMILREITKL